MIGIYRILCKKNGRMYIGSSGRVEYRIRGHLNRLKSNKHKYKDIQKYWNEYGENNFSFDIIEYVSNMTDLKNREQFHINKNKNKLFNIRLWAYNHDRTNESMPKKSISIIKKSLIGNKRRKGIKHRQIDKEKISKSLKKAYKSGLHKPPNIKISMKNFRAWHKVQRKMKIDRLEKELRELKRCQ
jgi:group I intron endonuclease